MKLSVIIVSYNVKHYLYQCLLSLEKALDGVDAEVIVYDNHSKDDTVACLSPKFPDVTFISGSHNLGFSKANNHAIRQSQGQYVLLLNPDTIVAESTIREALAFFDAHPEAGGAGVRMLKADGTDAMESRRGIPTPFTAFYKMSGLSARFPKSHRFGAYYMSYLPWDSPQRIEVISGACFFIRRKALDEVGLLDEDFFMYGEDIDLSYRLIKGGWQNWYLPLPILHYKGESTQKSSFRYVHVFYEAMLIFFRKHYGNLSRIFFYPVQLAIYLKAFAALLKVVLKRTRRNLGFVSNRNSVDPTFIFYVAPEHQAKCKDMALKNGLISQFEEIGKPDMDEQLKHQVQGKAYIVFDSSAFSYEEMFRIMAANKAANLSIAVYYPQVDMMITAEDVIAGKKNPS